jgi:Fic-DOC domain mobile mystery protein B
MIENMQYPEGATPLDPNELEGLKHKHITTQGELDQLEQANISSGLRWLGRHRADVLTDDFVISLHKRLFGDVWNWAGMFRKTGKNIGTDPLFILVELRALIDDAKYWANNKTYPSLEAAVRFHHRLVKVHPFPNGKGRHARIMADAILDRVYGSKPIDWAGGHNLQKMNVRRADYIAALKAADGGNYSPLFIFCGSTKIHPQ